MLHLQISKWLENYIKKANLQYFIVGISGGIDSALTSTLCAQTNIKTLAVSMPLHQNEAQLLRAHKHIDWLKTKYSNVESVEIDLTETFEIFKKNFSLENKLALANTRSRLRMVTLYQLAGMYSGLVVGTGNKVEDFGVGFFTKYGDGGVDISPIADLTKSEVREQAKILGVLEEIILAKPTDGLWDDERTDEDQIGASYEELEWAMNYNETEKISLRQEQVLKIFKKFNSTNLHKMQPVPVYKQ
jgi:NAD+ synthase